MDNATDVRLAEIAERHANDDASDGAETAEVILGALRELAGEHGRELAGVRQLLAETGEEMRVRGRALGMVPTLGTESGAISPRARAGAHAAFAAANAVADARDLVCNGGIEGPDFDHHFICDAVARAVDTATKTERR